MTSALGRPGSPVQGRHTAEVAQPPRRDGTEGARPQHHAQDKEAGAVPAAPCSLSRHPRQPGSTHSPTLGSPGGPGPVPASVKPLGDSHSTQMTRGTREASGSLTSLQSTQNTNFAGLYRSRTEPRAARETAPKKRKACSCPAAPESTELPLPRFFPPPQAGLPLLLLPSRTPVVLRHGPDPRQARSATAALPRPPETWRSDRVFGARQPPSAPATQRPCSLTEQCSGSQPQCTVRQAGKQDKDTSQDPGGNRCAGPPRATPAPSQP